VRSLLKWAGNKHRLLNQILPVLPEGNRLVEPFLGSGAIFLNTNYTEYCLSDNNPDLIHLYRFLKMFGPPFIDYCQSFFTPENNTKERYYALRETFNHSCDASLKSALFLFLNRHGYNGLCRYNSQGLYNVPFGSHPKPYFPRAEMLHFFAQAARAQFYVADFATIMQQATIGDVVYCDPPYVPLSDSASFTQYSTSPFGFAQQQTLVELATALAKRGIPVVISNHHTELTIELYKHATLIDFQVPRFISCKTRTPVRELLALYN
jgi:DNA adenine methylase